MGNPDVEGLPWPAKYERNVRALELFADGKLLLEIAEELGMNRQSVSVVLRQAGVSPQARGWARERPGTNIQRDEEIRAARAAGKTLAAIGKRFRLTRQRIQQIAAAEKESTE